MWVEGGVEARTRLHSGRWRGRRVEGAKVNFISRVYPTLRGRLQV